MSAFGGKATSGIDAAPPSSVKSNRYHALSLGLGVGMRRRDFIAALGGAAAMPLAAYAQQAQLPTIGVLGAGTPSGWAHWVAAFVQRLRELGWVEGRTVAMEVRWAEGRPERYTEIAAEFVRLRVDVIVTVGSAVVAINAYQNRINILAVGARLPTSTLVEIFSNRVVSYLME